MRISQIEVSSSFNIEIENRTQHRKTKALN